MCYSIFLSTDSNLDLETENGELITFEQEVIKEPVRSILQYKHKWYVGSKSRCSCTFRHLLSTELGFSEPVDWYPESEDELKATLIFIEIVRRLIDQGHRVDCVDLWQGTPEEGIKEQNVNLKNIADEEFRFFENYHFVFE